MGSLLEVLFLDLWSPKHKIIKAFTAIHPHFVHFIPIFILQREFVLLKTPSQERVFGFVFIQIGRML